MTTEIVQSPVNLPVVHGYSAPMLDALTAALGIPRNVLASNDQIQNAWNSLPQLLNSIPPELRDEGIMRMCVAVASGLFDSALNYAWNAAVIELREKVRRFDIHIIPQILDKDFDEQKLMDLQDSQLLDLCLKLNLISENGYFMLNQCRDIRNNFSAAHPTIGTLDEFEFLNFLNRCNLHALSNEQNATGVDIKSFMEAINDSSFASEQINYWHDRITNTFDAQRDTIFGMLHGIYCDPNKEEHSRVTAITICNLFSSILSPAAISILVNQHQRYQAKGEQNRLNASQEFFKHLKLLALLSESERHAMISSACMNLNKVHQAMNNFYNEQPFAERLASLAVGHEIPDTVKYEFVEVAVTCSVGNEWGTANSADPYYRDIINGFSPREIQIMLELPEKANTVRGRINGNKRCRDKYISLVGLLNVESIPTASKSTYEKWLNSN